MKYHNDDGSDAIKSIRAEFEEWYASNCFDYEDNPIGSQQCDHQWRAWLACRRSAPAVTDEMVALAHAAYCVSYGGGNTTRESLRAALRAALETPDAN